MPATSTRVLRLGLIFAVLLSPALTPRSAAQGIRTTGQRDGQGDERRRGDNPRVPDDAEPNLVANAAPTGDYRIDALLSPYQWPWTSVTYSFYEDSVFAGSYYGTETVGEVSEPVKTNVRAIMALLSTMMNVTFVEVTETSSTIGYIRFMDSTAPGYAYAYYPSSTAMFSLSGDVHLNVNYDRLGDTNGFQHPAGQHGYVSLIHEIGHAVGLKHPHDSSPNLPANEDNFARTVMTYNFLGNSPGTMMGYDLMALHYLYGHRPNRTGNDIYVASRAALDQYQLGSTLFINPSTATKQAIWDSGGFNTLDLSALTGSASGYRVDLQPLGWISTGAAYQTTYFTAGLSLGPGVSIRRLLSSVSNDIIYANAEANVFAGYASNRVTGNDEIWGATSDDTVDLSGYAPNQVVETPSGNDLVLNFGTNGRITIKGYYLGATPVIAYGGVTPSASINDVNVIEGNSGQVAATFTVSLTSPATSNVSVNWATASDSATAGTDFTSASGTASFAPGESQKTLTVMVTGDTAIESNEQFFVNLSNPTSGLTVSDSQGVGIITNDDLPPNQLPVAVASVSPTSGTAPLTVNFSSAGSSDPDGSIVSYAWSFSDGGSSSSPNPSRTYNSAGTYTATLTVTDNRGGTGTATATVTVNPAPLVNMWITAISGQALAQGKNKYARVTVTVRDANGQPVSGAVVTGQWSGARTGTGSGTTASNGTVSIDSAKQKTSGTTTFTVTGITRSGYNYTPAQNSASSVTVTIP